MDANGSRVNETSLREIKLTGGRDLQTLHRHVCDCLRSAGVETAELDARLLVARAIGEDWTILLLRPDRAVSEDERARIEAFLTRRLSGEPVSRILGEREFWGLAFDLNGATLDPRCDTETVVECCLAIAEYEGWCDGAPVVLDLGTGSGCILVALMHELVHAKGLGTDRSHEALLVARRNAERHGVGRRTRFLCGDWDEALDGPFDIIVSNPPYIPSGDIGELMREVGQFDPRAALDGGVNGLAAYRRIVPAAGKRLKPGGWLVVEVGAGQADAVAGLFTANGFRPGGDIPAVTCDLAGHERVVSMQRPAPTRTIEKKEVGNRPMSG